MIILTAYLCPPESRRLSEWACVFTTMATKMRQDSQKAGRNKRRKQGHVGDKTKEVGGPGPPQ